MMIGKLRSGSNARPALLNKTLVRLSGDGAAIFNRPPGINMGAGLEGDKRAVCLGAYASGLFKVG